MRSDMAIAGIEAKAATGFLQAASRGIEAKAATGLLPVAAASSDIQPPAFRCQAR